MIYTFDNVRPQLRTITFNGRNSYDDFGLTISKSTGAPVDEVKTNYEEIPFSNGSFDFTEINDSINYRDKTWIYVFNLLGTDDKELEERIAKIRSWLLSVGNGDLRDSDYENWKFVKARFTNFYIEYEPHGVFTWCHINVSVICAPYMRTLTGRLITCCTLTPEAGTARYLYTRYRASSQTAPVMDYLAQMYDRGLSVTAEAEEQRVKVTLGSSYTVPVWLALKRTDGTSEYLLTAGSGCAVIGGSTYLCIYAYAARAVFYVSADSGGTPVSGQALAGYFTALGWLTSGEYESWYADILPATDHMRLLSETKLELQLDSAGADPGGFALASPTLMSVSGAKSTPMKLQYCTVKERL